MAPVLTNAEGRFAIERMHRGTYDLVAEGAKGSSRVAKPGVKTGETVTLQLEPLGTLTGRVTSNGAPVTVYDLDCKGPFDIERRITADDGAYALEHLAPGAYDCTATADTGTAEGKVDVPTGPATLPLALVPWASITGVVVNALSGQPMPGLAIAASADASGFDPRMFSDALAGKGPVTDANGRFVIDRLAPGKGKLTVSPKDSIFEKIASRDYELAAGQKLDIGTIRVVPQPTGDKGTLGLSTTVENGTLTVSNLKPGGPAEGAGVKVGDKIVAIDGHPVADVTAEVASQLLSSGQVTLGQVVQLSIDRGGTKSDISVTAAKWP
jgi:hypothetical protein